MGYLADKTAPMFFRCLDSIHIQYVKGPRSRPANFAILPERNYVRMSHLVSNLLFFILYHIHFIYSIKHNTNTQGKSLFRSSHLDLNLVTRKSVCANNKDVDQPHPRRLISDFV